MLLKTAKFTCTIAIYAKITRFLIMEITLEFTQSRNRIKPEGVKDNNCRVASLAPSAFTAYDVGTRYL